MFRAVGHHRSLVRVFSLSLSRGLLYNHAATSAAMCRPTRWLWLTAFSLLVWPISAADETCQGGHSSRGLVRLDRVPNGQTASCCDGPLCHGGFDLQLMPTAALARLTKLEPVGDATLDRYALLAANEVQRHKRYDASLSPHISLWHLCIHETNLSFSYFF